MNIPEGLRFSAQTRLHFDPELHLSAGIKDFYVTPFTSICEGLMPVAHIKERLCDLKQKCEEVKKLYSDILCGAFMYVVNQAEGQCSIPKQYRKECDIDGNISEGYVCFLDEQRQQDLLEQYHTIAELGFDALLIDDDFRDALCYCDEHIKAFAEETGENLTREKFKSIVSSESDADEVVDFRRRWLEFKRRKLEDFGRRLEKTVHDAAPGCRIGICISAKRLNDLSGRAILPWLEVFDTKQAPVFVRLCGEYYTTDTLEIIQSAAWHQYYRELVPDTVKKITEISYCHPVYPQFKGQVRQQIEMMMASGLTNQLLAWPTDFTVNNLWAMLESEAPRFEQLQAVSSDVRESAGIAVYCPENRGCLNSLSGIENRDYDEVKAYAALARLGFPVRLVQHIDPENPVTLITSYVTEEDADAIVSSLTEGRTVIVDGYALWSFSKICNTELVRVRTFEIDENVRFERVAATSEQIDEATHFPCGSFTGIKPDEGTEIITELIDCSGDVLSAGIVRYKACNGTVIVLSHSLKRIEHRLPCKPYNKLFAGIIENTAGLDTVWLEGDTFIIPLLFMKPRPRAVLVNCSPDEETISLRGQFVRGKKLWDPLAEDEVCHDRVRVKGLGVKIIELSEQS